MAILLLESGSSLLLEDGFDLLLELSDVIVGGHALLSVSVAELALSVTAANVDITMDAAHVLIERD